MTLLQLAGVPEAPLVPDGITCAAEMDRTALVFLHKPLARQLAVAWKLCAGADAVWFDTAGVTDDEERAARKLAIALRASGICRDGGVLDETAGRYIAALIAATIQRGQHGKDQDSKRSRRR